MGRPKGSKNKTKDTLGSAGSKVSKEVSSDNGKSMTVAVKEQILELAKTKTVKEISGIVGFEMDWVAAIIGALYPDIDRKLELTKNFFHD
jgi:hypothetical protein